VHVAAVVTFKITFRTVSDSDSLEGNATVRADSDSLEGNATVRADSDSLEGNATVRADSDKMLGLLLDRTTY